MKTYGIIPSRFGSSRFPGKPLAMLAGKPLVAWVVEAVKKAKSLDEVFVATDDERIVKAVEQYGGVAVMTPSELPSGTDRIACAARNRFGGDFGDDDILVNIQGDEPLIDPKLIDELVAKLTDSDVEMATAVTPIKTAEDFAAKNFLEKNYPELKDSFMFYDSMQKVFGDYMHENFPGTKLYHFTLRNSYGAEAKETGDVDYSVNARELYRIFLRCGVNPATRKGMELEELGEYTRCERYEALLNAGGWKLNGGVEELSFEENGKSYKAAICHNLGSVKKAIENIDKYDVIKVVG